MIGLKLGESLDRPTAWKRIQMIINIISPILALTMPEHNEAIVSTVAAINAYLTVATTEKINIIGVGSNDN